MSSLIYSPFFDLTKTYFLIAGVAGVNPKIATIGSVTFARFAVQVTLQYEMDARDKPTNFSTGYVPQGATAPNQYPTILYGTEVFELNENLRQLVISVAEGVNLTDTEEAQQYHANYASDPLFAPASGPPAIVGCDTVSSDAFWSGKFLAEAFENATTLFTNGSATYCSTQAEDSGTLEVLLRGTVSGLVDFERIIAMRSISDIDRPYEGQSAADNLFFGFAGFDAALQNMQLVGTAIVEHILNEWETTFEGGVPATNYIGDIFGTMGGQPNFGPGSLFQGQEALRRRRSLVRRVRVL